MILIFGIYDSQTLKMVTFNLAMLKKSNEQLQKDKITLIVSNASYQLRLVIGAICSNALLSDNDWTTTSAICEKYSQIISKDVKRLSYRRILDLLVELENTGLGVPRKLCHKAGMVLEQSNKLKLLPDLVGPSKTKI
jgi:Cdc6-like AAA superfamily ATPase